MKKLKVFLSGLPFSTKLAEVNLLEYNPQFFKIKCGEDEIDITALVNKEENYVRVRSANSPYFFKSGEITYQKAPNTPNLSLIHISEPTRPY